MLNTSEKNISEAPCIEANTGKNQAFYYYLSEKGFTAKTIAEHLSNLNRFEKWIAETGLTTTEYITYAELLGYVQYLKNRSLQTETVNLRLNTLRKYFEYLKEEGIIEINPARRLHVRGAVKKIIVNPLSFTELENLYHEYAKPKTYYREQKCKTVHRRNTLILSLMISQALHSGELDKIETAHVNLSQGLIYIPGTRRSNGRELKLESRQIILFHKYITETPFKTEKLFECHPTNTFTALLQELKGLNPTIKNAGHIRASVILHWMKMYDKRQVQYMAGHKWISSTENYEVQELTGLTDLLTRHHPFS